MNTYYELEPGRTHYDGSIDLSGRKDIKALPEILIIEDSLDLSDCRRLTELPKILTVGKWLDLSGCTGLKSLPNDLTVGDGLNLNDCTGITELPDGLKVGRSIDLSGCTGIKKMPNDLKIGYAIILNRHTRIENAVHNCGEYNRSICAYKNLSGQIVVSLGCFVGTEQMCIDEINKKYKGYEAEDYISKVKLAFQKYKNQTEKNK